MTKEQARNALNLAHKACLAAEAVEVLAERVESCTRQIEAILTNDSKERKKR